MRRKTRPRRLTAAMALILLAAILQAHSSESQPVEVEDGSGGDDAPAGDQAEQAASTTARTPEFPVKEKYDLTKALQTLTNLETLLDTLNTIYSKTELFAQTDGAKKLVGNMLTAKYSASKFADARAACVRGEGYLFAPTAYMDEIAKVFAAHGLARETDPIWIDIYKDARTSEWTYAGNHRPVPITWSATQTGSSNYASITETDCYTLNAGATVGKDAKLVKTTCTDQRQYLCQFELDPEKDALETMRKLTLADIVQQKVNVQNFKVFLNGLEENKQCGEVISGGEEIGKRLQIEQPLGKLMTDLSENDNAKAAQFMPLIADFIDDLRTLRAFHLRLTRSETTRSADKTRFCVHALTPHQEGADVITSITDYLKKVWRGDAGPIPHWMLNIGLAAIAFLSMLISFLSLCISCCRQPQDCSCPPEEGKEAGNDKDKGKNSKIKSIKSNADKADNQDSKRSMNFLKRIRALFIKTASPETEEEALYKAIELKSRPLQREAKNQQQMIICTPKETLYAPYEPLVSQAMLSKLSDRPQARAAGSGIKTRTPKQKVTVSFAQDQTPLIRSTDVYPDLNKIYVAADNLYKPSAPLLEDYDKPIVAVVRGRMGSRKKEREGGNSSDSSDDSQRSVRPFKNLKKLDLVMSKK